MARHPKPTALHEASGAYMKNPKRRRSNEAIPRKGIGTAPESAPVSVAEIWDELVDAVVPGVLGNCDRIHLEILSHLISQFRIDPEGTNSAKVAQIDKMLGKLGMNPVDRLRIKAPEDSEESKEDGYF